MTKINQKESPVKDDSSNSSCNESNGMPPAKSLTTNKVKKSTNNHNRMDTNVSTDEMQLLLAKLKELVPNIPRNKKLSKLEIIQYVIDYIFDLQLALDTHPPTCQTSNSSSPSSSALQSLRQPLAEMWSS
ncbi:DNA-binding protein inhibitor ID-2-like [Oppia nitens]|uniref:DNA-binding protein inhibitor ID-2-like n=1 Tax=Oppia nitens TaxID=1686743 RepID=UPI0023DBF36D|nr:DNA-binding protein inhibitor ID-2-like [Oppia nitens]